MRNAFDTPLMDLSARSTWLRYLGSPISRMNRPIILRSFVVVTEPTDGYVLNGQRSSDIGKKPDPVGCFHLDGDPESEASDSAQCTATMRSCCLWVRCVRFTQSARCTDTPWPWVTNPVISSPGTGLQHLDSRTHTSGAPSPRPRNRPAQAAAADWPVRWSLPVPLVAAIRPADWISSVTTDCALTGPHRPPREARSYPDTAVSGDGDQCVAGLSPCSGSPCLRMARAIWFANLSPFPCAP